jgi:hypothetical protein
MLCFLKSLFFTVHIVNAMRESSHANEGKS